MANLSGSYNIHVVYNTINTCYYIGCNFVQPWLWGCCPKFHKCFWIVGHVKGRTLRHMQHGQKYYISWPTFSWAHLPPYSIFYASPWGPHLNDILSQDSHLRVPKFPKLGLPQLWGLITLCENLQLRWGLKQSCSFVESFPTVCHTPPSRKEIVSIPNF
jgi:hypothetical protein